MQVISSVGPWGSLEASFFVAAVGAYFELTNLPFLTVKMCFPDSYDYVILVRWFAS